MKYFIASLFAMGILLIGTGFTAYAEPSDNATDVKIGGLLPHDTSGMHRVFATHAAINDFNNYLENKDITDWRLSVDVRDTQRNSEKSLNETRDLIDKGIKYVVGPSGSSSVKAIKEHIDKNDIDLLVVSCCSTSPAIAEVDSIFRLAPSDDKQGPVIANILQKNGKQFLIPVWVDESFGNGLVSTTSDAFEMLGGTVIRDTSLRYDECDRADSTCKNQLDVLAERMNQVVLENMRLHGAETIAILYVGFHTEHLAREAIPHDALGMVTWVGSDADALKPDLVSDKNSDVREFLVDTGFQNQIFEPDPNSKRFQSLEERLKQEFPGVAFSPYAYASYDAVWAVGLSIEAAGGPGADFDDIVSGVLGAVQNNTEGALGPIILNKQGDIDSATYATLGIVETPENPAGTWTKIGTYYTDNRFVQSYQSPLEPINIGILLELTGPVTFNDPDYAVAMTLARQDYNDLSKDSKIHITTIDTSTGILASLNTLHSGIFDSFYHDRLRSNINATLSAYSDGFASINDKYKDDDYYPFVIDRAGISRAHGHDSGNVGVTNINDLGVDISSGEIFEVFTRENPPEELWVQYQFSSPGATEYTTKRSLLVYHADSDMVVGAGYHPVLGNDSAYEKPLEQVIDEAARMIRSNGPLSIVNTFSYDKADKPFYAFVSTTEGHVLASAAAPRPSVISLADLEGLDKTMDQIQNELASTNDTTWIRYIFNNPANGLEEQKHTLLKRVNIADREYFIGAGYYPQEKLLHFVGPTTSSNTAKIKDYANENDLIIVSPSSTAESLAIPGDNIFRLTPSDKSQVAALAELATTDAKTHLVIVNRDDVWANGIADGLQVYDFESYRGVDTDNDGSPDSLLIPEADQSFNYDGLAERLEREVARAVSDAGSLDSVAVLYVGFDQSMISLYAAIDRLASPGDLLAVDYYGTDGVANDADVVNDPVTGRITSAAGFSATIFDVQPNVLNGKLKDRIDRLGVNFNSYSSSSYDSIMLLASAIKAADENKSVKDILQSTSGYKGALNDQTGITLNSAGDMQVQPTDYTIFSIAEDNGNYIWIKQGDSAPADSRIAELESRFTQFDSSLAQLDSRFTQFESNFTQLDSRLAHLESTIQTLTSKIENLLGTIMAQQEQIDRLETAITGTDSTLITIRGDDGSYITLPRQDSYMAGDSITVTAFLNSSGWFPGSITHVDYGLFLVAGHPEDVQYDEFTSAGYLGKLFGPKFFELSGTDNMLYGEGFYCNGARSDFGLKFDRTDGLANEKHGAWADPPSDAVACPLVPNTAHTFEFRVSDDYIPRDDYAFVFATGTDTGLASPTFAITPHAAP